MGGSANSRESGSENGSAGRVVFFMRPGRGAVETRVGQGVSPSDFLYGFGEVRRVLKGTILVEAETPLKGTFVARCWSWLEERLFPLTGFRMLLPAVYSNWEALSRAQLIVTNIDSIGMPLMICRAMGLLKARLIHISQGTTNALERSSHEGIRDMCQSMWIRTCYRETDRVVVLGVGARDALVSRVRVAPDRVICLQFGVDTDFWSPGREERTDNPYLLSVGSDAGRDYDTLLQASFALPLKVVTRLPLKVSKAGVEVVSDLTDEVLRDLYRNAVAVLIPLHDISQPSGQSATLQAMACGCTVLITKTRGFWDPEGLIRGVHLEMVRPCDARDWERVVAGLTLDPQARNRMGLLARSVVCARYGVANFGAELADYCRRALEQSEYPQV